METPTKSRLPHHCHRCGYYGTHYSVMNAAQGKTELIRVICDECFEELLNTPKIKPFLECLKDYTSGMPNNSDT